MKHFRLSELLITYSLALGVVVFAFTQPVRTETMGQPEEFTAGAIDINHGRTGQIQITVNRWSTPVERATLAAALLQKGPDGLLKALQDMKPVGTIRTPDTLGYDLHYAAERPGVDGGRDIAFATDRPINFWEAVNRPRISDYPFTIVQLHMKADGTGEGKLAVAAKVTGDEDTGMIEIENYDMQPVQLVDVKAQPRRHS
jgi:hypothetical protein